MFSVRIVTANHYVASPIRELDVTFSDFRRSEVKQVPVIRIFGSTPAGQKTCLHIHGVFPYIYIPYDGTEPTDKYTQQFANSLDLAIQVSLGKASGTTQHVFKVSLVTGMALYGYHTKEQQFLKIYFYNPLMVKRAMELLQTGAVMNKVFQPYEAHVPIILQFLMDYNLYGMNLVNIAAVKFRKTEEDKQDSSEALSGSSGSSGNTNDTVLDQSTQGSGASRASVNRQVWNKESIPRSQWLSDEVVRQSTCELEVDAVAVDILNRMEIEGSLGANPGLVAIWEDEKRRREQLDQVEDLLPPSSPDRGDLPDIESEIQGRLRLQEIIDDLMKQVKDAQSDELSESLTDEDSPAAVSRQPSLSQGALSPTPSSQIDFHLSQERDEDGPPLLIREDTEPVVNEDLVHSFMEASQKSVSTQRQGSDKELVQLLVDLAHSESQVEEPEEGSILLGQSGRAAGDAQATDGIAAGGDGDDDNDEGVLDALESLHMSQAWDDHTPNNELDEEDGDDENEGGSDDEDGEFDTAHSTLQELEDALISITNADEAEKEDSIPQYDGADDEDEEPTKQSRINKLRRKRNTQKPARYSEGDDYYCFTSMKPNSPRSKRGGGQKTNSQRASATLQSTSYRDTDATPDPRDKLLKEFVIKITDKSDEEIIKKMPYWNPVLKLKKCSSDPGSFIKRTGSEGKGSNLLSDRKQLLQLKMEITRNANSKIQQEGLQAADGTIWGVKQDSLSKGMVKKTLGLQGRKESNKKPDHLNKESFMKKCQESVTKGQVKKTLGIKRKREPSGYTSDSSNASVASHSYSMRTKRERVMYREEDDFDEILGLTTKKTSGTIADEGAEPDISVVWQKTPAETEGSPSRYKPCLNISGDDEGLPTMKPRRGRRRNLIGARGQGRGKRGSKLSLSRRGGMGRSVMSDASVETDDSIVEVVEESTSEDDVIDRLNKNKDRTWNSIELPPGPRKKIETDPVSTGSEESGMTSPKLFDDSVISLQSSAEVSRCENETMALSALPEKKYGETGAAQSQHENASSFKDSDCYPTDIADNSRSRIYSSLPTSPRESVRGRSPPIRCGCKTRSGKRQRGSISPRTDLSSNVPLADQSAPPMFSVVTDDSKEDYRDAMWGLSYFSPLHPDPALSPPRAWSPSQPSVQTDDVPWMLSNDEDGKKNGDILTDLANIDRDQMMKEIAEFQRDHGDIFQHFAAHPQENVMQSDENTSRQHLEDQQTKEDDMEKDETQTSMDIDVVPDSQSEEEPNAESREESGKDVSAKVDGEPNNNWSSGMMQNSVSKDGISSNHSGDGKESSVPMVKDLENTSIIKKFDSVRLNRAVPLEVRGDPSKKVVGTVHPTQHVKPHESNMETLAQANNGTCVSAFEKDTDTSLDLAAIKARTQSLSAELVSPIDAEPSAATPSSFEPMSLLSPTRQPKGFFQAPKARQQTQHNSQSKDVSCTDDVNNGSSKNTSEISRADDTRQDSDASAGDDKGQGDSSQKEQVLSDTQNSNTQQSDSSSPLTPGQRPPESTHSVSPTPGSPDDLDFSDVHASSQSTPIEFDFARDSLTHQDQSLQMEYETISNTEDSSLAGVSSSEAKSGVHLSQIDNTELSKTDATSISDVATPWRTFTSDIMTPVQSGNDPLSVLDSNTNSDGAEDLQTSNAELLQNSTPWKTFSSDCMTPVKEPLDDSLSFDASHKSDTIAKSQTTNSERLQEVSISDTPTAAKMTSGDVMMPVKVALDDSSILFDSNDKIDRFAKSEAPNSGSLQEAFVNNKTMPLEANSNDIISPGKIPVSDSAAVPNANDNSESLAKSQIPNCGQLQEDFANNAATPLEIFSRDTKMSAKSSNDSSLLLAANDKTEDLAQTTNSKQSQEDLSNDATTLPKSSSGETTKLAKVPTDTSASSSDAINESDGLRKSQIPNSEQSQRAPLNNASTPQKTNDSSVIILSGNSSTSSLFDAKSPNDSSVILLSPTSDLSKITKETAQPASFQSQTSAFTAVKPRRLQMDSVATQSPSVLPVQQLVQKSNATGATSGKRKFEDVSEMDDSDKKHRGTERRGSQEQNSQESGKDGMGSVEDMSIGDSSMSIPESPHSQEENNSTFHTPNTSASDHPNRPTEKVLVNGDKLDNTEQLPNGQSHYDNHPKSQNSSATQEKLQTKEQCNSQVSLADKVVAMATKLLKPMKPVIDPPTMSSVKESLLRHGLHEVQHQKAFWSRPEDQPSWNSRQDILHQSQPKCVVPSELDDAQTKLSDIGLHHWRTVMGTMNNAPTSSQAPNTAFNILHEMTNMNYRASVLGEANTVITPCKLPPSKRKVEQWLNREHAQAMQNNHSDKERDKSATIPNNEQVDPSVSTQTDHFKTPAQSKKESKLEAKCLQAKCLEEQPSTSRHVHQAPATSTHASMATVSMTTKESTTAHRDPSTITSTPLPPCFSSPVPRGAGLLHSTPVRAPSTRTANEPGVTPICGGSSQRQSLNMGSQRKTGEGPLANLVRRQSLFFTPRETVGGSQLLRKASDTSQIDGPTPNNTFDFKVSQHNLQDAKALHEVQHLTILSLELHIRTRRDYRPDPEADPIRAVFFCIQIDSLDGKKQEKGMIVVNEPNDSNPNVAGTSNNGTVTATQHQPQDHTGIHELTVIQVADEKSLFDEIVTLIRKHDPDILVGYEIQQLSWGFLLQRAAFLSINLCAEISRLPESKKESSFNSEKDEYGADHMSEIHIAGRIVLNVWRLMRHEVALNIYTFENVAFHVLHQRVPKFSFRSLSDWFDHKTNVLRWRVVEYYTLRVCCNLQVLEQRDLIGRTSELARLFGIQFYNVLSRGSQYRVESMMLRLAKPLNYIAVSPSRQQVVRMKAPECIPLVMEPESRFYHDPVIVLDFQSLYPSMMIAYNYCFSTCLGRLEHVADGGQYVLGCSSLSVPATTLRRLQNSDSLHVSPNGIVFVKQNVRHGVLPRMVDQILSTRIMVKKALKDHKDDKILERMLDNRQLGLKLIANVTYGYTAANYSGRMPCVEVADSVVRKGRETLERAIWMVENNEEWGARVVYGDTDSMFVLLEGASKERAFKVGKEIAAAVTAANPKPVKLKFEKVYHPCVLQAKKRYVGYMYESPEQTEPEYDAKGIETVRRDGCPAVAKILERSIKVLFTTKDMSQVKDYVQKQFKKIIDGSASMQDLTFAKEYRGRQSYQPGACVPSLEITRRMMAVDRCSEPRRGERVPYVVVYGSPGLPLIQLVRRPEEVLRDPSLRLNSTYYVTRQIIPALNRVFSLMGVDTTRWYQELPRNQRVNNQAGTTAQVKKGTIAQYFSSLNCVVCDKLTKTGLCDSCREDAQQTAAILSGRIQEWNQSWIALDKVCNSCCGFKDEQPGCDTLDCPVRYKLARVSGQLEKVPSLQCLLDSLIKDNTGDTTASGMGGMNHNTS